MPENMGHDLAVLELLERASSVHTRGRPCKRASASLAVCLKTWNHRTSHASLVSRVGKYYETTTNERTRLFHKLRICPCKINSNCVRDT